MQAINLVVIAQQDLFSLIKHLGEMSYPEETVGFMFGRYDGDTLFFRSILPMKNRCEADSRCYRYELTAEDWMNGEIEATRRQLGLVGIFHSHPDHLAVPSQCDLDHALPNLAYVITSVYQGK